MANTRIQVKRTSTSGRTANVTTSGNSTYIAAGELALNMADGILYSSNGSSLIEIGANNTNIKSTGTITASGIIYGLELHSTMASGDEGGEIKLAKPPNATTDGGVTIDAYQNKVRIFEQGGSARGVYIDLTAAAGGVGTNLLAAAGSGTVTSVGSGDGLTGGPITGSGTLSVLANTGVVANSTGLFVNASYIATISSNNASYLGGNLPAYYTNATNITTGTLPIAQIPAGVVNTTSAFTLAGAITLSSTLNVGGLLTQNGVNTRVVDYATGSTLTINCDTTDLANTYNTEAVGTLTINPVSGTARDGQKLMLRIRSTNIQILSWNTTVSGAFTGSVDLSLPTATSGSSKYDYFGFVYSTAASRWHLLAKNFGF